MSTDTLPERVYANYRAALQGHSGTRQTRAGGRKQVARQLTADRYKLPISQVKAIVREMDAAHGITHEHPQAYLAEQALVARCTEIQNAYEAHPTGCACGNFQKVRVRLNHVEKDEAGQPTPLLSCFLCYLDEGAKNWVDGRQGALSQEELAVRLQRTAEERARQIAEGPQPRD